MLSDLAYWPYKSRDEMEKAERGLTPKRRMDGSLVTDHSPVPKEIMEQVEQLRKLMKQ